MMAFLQAPAVCAASAGVIFLGIAAAAVLLFCALALPVFLRKKPREEAVPLPPAEPEEERTAPLDGGGSGAGVQQKFTVKVELYFASANERA